MGNILKKLKNKYKNSLRITKHSTKKAFLIFVFFLFLLTPVVAEANPRRDLDRVNQRIREAQRELSNKREEKNTLQGQVNSLNNEIAGIEYQISLTDQKINLLDQRIAQTENEIINAEKELRVANEQIAEFVRSMYLEGQLSAVEVIVRSESFSEFVNRAEYLEQAQLRIKEIADRITELRNRLELQKKELESDKKEATTARLSQANQRNSVNSMRSVKNGLLAAAKGDEARYQSMLTALNAERQRIEQRLWQGDNQVTLGRVRAGDIIGRIGNSGFSTGCHLHFEIRNANRQHVNPGNFIGNGYFIHPVPGVRVSAPYGFSSSYFPGWFHTGIDYADGCIGTPVRAVADGEIILRVTGRPNTFPWSFEYGNYVMIRHTNGMFSLYAHLR